MNETIIHINTARDVFGPEKTTINECLDLIDKGIACEIVNLDGDADIPFNDKILKTEIKYTQLSCRSGIDFRAIYSLYKIIKQYESVLIHSHGYKADIHALIAAKICKVPLVTTIHGWTTESFKVKVYEFIQRSSWRFFDRIFCVSDSYRKVALDLGIKSSKLHLLYNGIKISGCSAQQSEAKLSAFKQRVGADEDTLLVGIIGRLSIEKGHHLFIDIAKNISQKTINAKFVIIGDGPERKALEDYVAKLGLAGYVVFAGHQDDMQSIYNLLDLVLMCSFREGLPNVLLESMFNEVSVVTVAVGGIPEVITDKQGGIVLHNRNADDFSKEVEMLLIDKDLRQAMGAAGKERVCSAFSFEGRMNKIHSHYTELLSTSTR